MIPLLISDSRCTEKISVQDIELELRLGIEPWHVLGEETSNGGTARFVDSSVERVQVKVRNFNADRYLVTCDGVPVPLKETSIRGEYVAGVRYRSMESSLCFASNIRARRPVDV